MKTTKICAVAIASLLTTGIFAQQKTTFGIRAGVNFQNLNGKDAEGDKMDGKLTTGFNAGVNAEIPVGIDFYLQPGLLYTTKGAKYELVGGSDDLKKTISYIELPVNFLYKPELGEGRMLLGFGPYAAYAVGGKNKIGDSKSDIEFGDAPSELKRFDAGANLLAGYEFSNKLSFQLNAGLGLVNINNRPTGDSKSTMKNTGFGVSLGYRFN
ncbi:porin family protein [Terrimonas alba]|uniref:porin family protein n=1 Tax=Terrimonas alba TaxID=3349636 RepID=UPI0035F4CEBA